MIISHEQAKAAAAYLKASGQTETQAIARVVSDEVMKQAVDTASHAPDLRMERVDEARVRMGEGSIDSREIAEKMLSRIVSDALR